MNQLRCFEIIDQLNTLARFIHFYVVCYFPSEENWSMRQLTLAVDDRPETVSPTKWVGSSQTFLICMLLASTCNTRWSVHLHLWSYIDPSETRASKARLDSVKLNKSSCTRLLETNQRLVCVLVGLDGSKSSNELTVHTISNRWFCVTKKRLSCCSSGFFSRVTIIFDKILPLDSRFS